MFKCSIKAVLFISGLIVLLTIPARAEPDLKVSDNHRFLVRADGRPFFYGSCSIG